ncbi:polyprenyl synthetase family protein [Jonesia quinghaiensis]|uniref:polyprenyl synthetase family protein n=1 Tax=Jonesia quinghaiensis TaxID=262806 RepID=UPI000420044E|nr:polyprenyl synthetase family protein [Jonesia quinghaiensis]
MPEQDAPDATFLTARSIREKVSSAVNTELDRQEQHALSISSDTAPLVAAWRDMASGGKRIRALLMYWAHEACATNSPAVTQDALINVGAALELFQAAALFHDDVMDRSDTRRGIPTAHKYFESLHSDAGYLGDREQYGSSAAILLGDLSLVASERLFREATQEATHRRRARAYFDDMRTIVTVGQFLDTHAQVIPLDDHTAALQRALHVIATKTSHYSVIAPVKIGAALAGASATVEESLEAFGKPLGTAFQLIDDDLGLFGDPAVTGKPAGDDLREGKRTVVVAHALAKANATERRVLEQVIVHHDTSPGIVESALAIIEDTGARHMTLDMAYAHHDEALRALEHADVSPQGKTILREIADFIVNRSS